MNEEKARKILGDAVDGDNLNSLGWYLSWEDGDEEAILDGRFTSEQLDAIAWWMKNKKPLTP